MLCGVARLRGADPGWSVRGGVEAKIGTKEANFARFWSILEGAALPRPPSGSATAYWIEGYAFKHAAQQGPEYPLILLHS